MGLRKFEQGAFLHLIPNFWDIWWFFKEERAEGAAKLWKIIIHQISKKKKLEKKGRKKSLWFNLSSTHFQLISDTRSVAILNLLWIILCNFRVLWKQWSFATTLTDIWFCTIFKYIFWAISRYFFACLKIYLGIFFPHQTLKTYRWPPNAGPFVEI